MTNKPSGVFGAKELNELFDQLDNSLGVKILQNINRSGGKIYKDEIKANAPIGNDNVYNSIKIEKDKTDGTALKIGVGSKGFVARFSEFGTAVRTTSGKGRVQKKKASRGRISPKPFVAPAIERATKSAIDAIYGNMGKVVLRTLKTETKKVTKAAKG